MESLNLGFINLLLDNHPDSISGRFLRLSSSSCRRQYQQSGITGNASAISEKQTPYKNLKHKEIT
jgi:hypothetical protein